MISKAIVIGAAPLETTRARRELKKSLRSQGVLRIAVDGGLEHFRSLGVRPDLYIGDLDSVRRVPEDLPSVFLPHEKNYSDLRAAIEILAEMQVRKLEVWAVTGGRADHHWASIQELGEALASSTGIHQLEAHGDEGDFYWATPQSAVKFATQVGAVVSIFDFAQSSGVSTRGLAYPLRQASFLYRSHGLSNRARAKKVEISLKKGLALVIVPKAQVK